MMIKNTKETNNIKDTNLEIIKELRAVRRIFLLQI